VTTGNHDQQPVIDELVRDFIHEKTCHENHTKRFRFYIINLEYKTMTIP
jgi:hypothetical protein